jgi:hypothetical protein
LCLQVPQHSIAASAMNKKVKEIHERMERMKYLCYMANQIHNSEHFHARQISSVQYINLELSLSKDELLTRRTFCDPD